MANDRGHGRSAQSSMLDGRATYGRLHMIKIILNPHLWQGLGETVECGLHDELDEANLRACARACVHARVRACARSVGWSALVGIKAGEQSSVSGKAGVCCQSWSEKRLHAELDEANSQGDTHARRHACVRVCVRVCAHVRVHIRSHAPRRFLIKRICMCVWGDRGGR
jgi:hypothetical protein